MDWGKILLTAFLGLCGVAIADKLSDNGYDFHFKDFFASKHDDNTEGE